MIDAEKIKKSLAFKIWDYFVLFLVVIAIGLLINSYFEITPEQQNKFLLYNTIISVIFLIDVIVRIIIFRKKYLFSAEIIIDILACSDIITPALRAVRGIKYTRFIRILRILRMLRVFRGLKAIKHSSQCFIEEKLFNSIAIIVILIMIVVSIIVSNFVDKRLHSFVDDNYRQILRAIVITSKTEEGKFSAEQFIEKLKMLDRVIYYKISLDTLDKPIENYISITKEELTHKYFPDDIYEISLNDKIVIKILIKELKFYVRIVEMLVLISALPLIAILLITLHLIILKYYIAPIHKINEVLETNLEQELKLIELDEKLQGSDIYQLQEKINNTLENNNTKLWEYYNAYEELRKKEQGE